MKFYTELSNVYDIVFPLDEDTVKFLSKDIFSGDNVLDLACGTGQYTIELGKLGANVIGVDLNGDMIKLAKKKSEGLSISFIEEDMTKLDKIGSKKNRLIFCIGNSIVHLDSKSKIDNFICDIYDSLEDNGIMVIQTVNFDRILKYNIDSLPIIDKSDMGIKLIRKYNYSKNENKLDFMTELTIKEASDEKKYFNSVPLLMLTKEDIIKMIKGAGFKNIEVYGGFNQKEYCEESYAMVVRAIK